MIVQNQISCCLTENININLDILTNSRVADVEHRKSKDYQKYKDSKSISNKPKGCKAFLRFPGRFFFVFIFIFLTNTGYAAYTVYDRWQDSRTTISHVLLVIFTGNLMIYLFYYTVRTWYASCFGSKKMLKDEILKQNEGILNDLVILFHRLIMSKNDS